jgi:hypothetical protein
MKSWALPAEGGQMNKRYALTPRHARDESVIAIDGTRPACPGEAKQGIREEDAN